MLYNKEKSNAIEDDCFWGHTGSFVFCTKKDYDEEFSRAGINF